jgi:hypothetical protein
VVPFNVTYEAVPDERLSELLAATNAAGFGTPALTPVNGAGTPVRSVLAGDVPRPPIVPPDPLAGEADLPSEWRMVRELEGQSYLWPQHPAEQYSEYRVYAGDTQREGTVHIALGKAERQGTWERDRLYIVSFLTTGTPQNALAEFLETDDYETTGEFIAVIRGRDGAGSKKMFSPTDDLPAVYSERFKVVLYNEHIRVKGAWSKLAVLADEADPSTMLNHALLQARRRGNL